MEDKKELENQKLDNVSGGGLINIRVNHFKNVFPKQDLNSYGSSYYDSNSYGSSYYDYNFNSYGSSYYGY